jgi:hypothetical protein
VNASKDEGVMVLELTRAQGGFRDRSDGHGGNTQLIDACCFHLARERR